MSSFKIPPRDEPTIAVGLIDRAESVSVRLDGAYSATDGRSIGPGELRVTCEGEKLRCKGAVETETTALELEPLDRDAGQFKIEATIGINFHWQQKEMQAFRGGLRLIAEPDDRVTVINRIPLETYITSVICSEMNAASPTELAKAHAVISRSWLLAQLDAQATRGPREAISPGEHISWTDREAHAHFDVCADDHCQRYQGIGRANSPDVAAAIDATRGQVLTSGGRPCDARYSKSCGGVVEEFQTAWADEEIPYLVALADAPNASMPEPPLTEEKAVREFIDRPPDAYCTCTDDEILVRVLNDYDRETRDFFRWQVRLTAAGAGSLVAKKLGLDLGRLLAMEPVERGPSGRLKRLRLVGEKATVVIGKELEIRRALSPTHLYSSAFVIDTEGPPGRPDEFVLTGAGWGHGVGLCQIGAAVMACTGSSYQDILGHYYPGAEIQQFYP